MNIFLSFINIILGSLIYFRFNSYEESIYLFFSSFLIFLLNCYLRFDNFLFLFRNLTLGIIGFVPLLIKYIYGPETSFYFGEPDLQIFDLCLKMYFCTVIALLSSEIGLELGKYFSSYTPHANYLSTNAIKSENDNWLIISLVCIPIIILVAYLTSISAGPPIWLASYTSEGQGQLLGNLQSIGVICLLAYYVGSQKANWKYKNSILILLVFIFLIWGMAIRGLRQDVISAILGLVFCYSLIKGKDFKINLTSIIIIFIAYIFFEMLGAARTLATVSNISIWEIFIVAFEFLTPKGLETGFNLANQNFFLFDTNVQVVMPGTLGPIAKTFSTTIFLVDQNYIDYQFGKTYFEYLLRSPPEFLYPGRPEDYAWMFLKYNTITIGGFFELAEIYFNFGILGMFFMPGIISFLISYVYEKAKRTQSILHYFLLFSFLGSLFRGAWYQTFAFYKTFLTSMILLLFFILIIFIFETIKKNVINKNLKFID